MFNLFPASPSLILSREEMAGVDRYSQEVLKIPGLSLMESASLKAWNILSNIDKDFIRVAKDKKLIFLAGAGNNGGDALVMARHAIIDGYREVRVYHYPSKSDLNKINLTTLKKITKDIFPISEFIKKASDKNLLKDSVLVDGIFGTGFTAKKDLFTQKLIRQINSLKQNRFSVVGVDIPTGLGKGVNVNNIIHCDLTITFGAYKDIFFYPNFTESIGELALVNPGFPEKSFTGFTKKPEKQHSLLTYQSKVLAPVFRKSDYKKSRGSVLIVGGSRNYLGAPIFSGLASIKTGSGLVSLLSTQENYQIQKHKTQEINNFIIYKVNDFIKKTGSDHLFKNFGAILIGPGLGNNLKQKEIETFFEYLLNYIESELAEVPILIFDANGIDWLKKYKKQFSHLSQNKKVLLVISPHVGEMARLNDTTTKSIDQDPYSWGEKTSTELGAFVVLKSHINYLFCYPTIDPTIAGNEISSIKSTMCYPNPNLGIGGSGDVLAGIIVSVLARFKGKKEKLDQSQSQKKIFDCIKSAVLIHSYAGKLSYDKYENFTAEELIFEIPNSIKYFNQTF